MSTQNDKIEQPPQANDPESQEADTTLVAETAPDTAEAVEKQLDEQAAEPSALERSIELANDTSRSDEDLAESKAKLLGKLAGAIDVTPLEGNETTDDMIHSLGNEILDIARAQHIRAASGEETELITRMDAADLDIAADLLHRNLQGDQIDNLTQVQAITKRLQNIERSEMEDEQIDIDQKRRNHEMSTLFADVSEALREQLRAEGALEDARELLGDDTELRKLTDKDLQSRQTTTGEMAQKVGVLKVMENSLDEKTKIELGATMENLVSHQHDITLVENDRWRTEQAAAKAAQEEADAASQQARPKSLWDYFKR